MSDMHAPPLSSSIEHFRAEVDRRADALGRRRRHTIGGGVVAIALVALATSSVLVAGGTPSHQAATPTTSGARAPVEGGASGGNTGAFGGAANGPSNVYLIDDRPSGFVATGVLTGMNITVLLPAPSAGRWGPAAVTTGEGSVLTSSGEEAYGAGGVQASFRAHGLGTAIITIPRLGDPPGSWQATVIVTGTGSPACSTHGVCH
jgi:hypothetical protein